MFSDKDNVVTSDVENSVIGKQMRITGTVISSGKVICVGQFDGTVECETFHILPGGKFNGEISASNVIIEGVVIGKISAGSVKLETSADFNGDVCYSNIEIEEGARVVASFSRDQVKNG